MVDVYNETSGKVKKEQYTATNQNYLFLSISHGLNKDDERRINFRRLLFMSKLFY